MQTSTKSSMKTIQLRQPKKQSTWKQAKEIVLNPYEAGKINYTEDENYEAYKVFSIMDVDNSGYITIRELQRLLMGQFSKTMPLDFDHPDSGIIWGLDPRHNVVIQSIEKDSPASKHFDIIPGFKLKKVNNTIITLENKVGLKQLHKELIRSGHGAIHYEFFEPFFLISKFTVTIDIEVEGRVYTGILPVGAVNEIRDFEELFQDTLQKANWRLAAIRVRVDPKSRQVRFECDEFPFRLLFATGPNYQTSCRYAIGFWAEDFDYNYVHVGQPLSIDLKMRLAEHEMDILLAELFNTFDTDRSGEFRFEEFRNFYIQFLSSEEKLQKMKDYASFRFRDLEEEKRMLDIIEARRKKAARRVMLKTKNADKIIIHMKKVAECSRIDGDGVKRRVFNGRREDQITRRFKKKNRGSGTAIVKYGAHKATGIEEEPSQDTVSLTKQRSDNIKKKQEVARKMRLNRAFNDVDVRKKEHKIAMMDAKKRFVRLHMAEVVDAFRRCQEDSNKAEMVHNEKGLLSFAMSYEKMIQSPQLRFFDSFGVPDPEDIEMDEVPSTKLHPAGISYFFIKKRLGEDYNARKIHPSFFGADYERESSKASMVALGAARVMMKNVNAMEKKLSRKLKSKKSNKSMLVKEFSDQIDWELIDDVIPPAKITAKKIRGDEYINIIETMAAEVTNAVISWGTTLVVLHTVREKMNSVLLQQMSVTKSLDDQYKDMSSAAQMLHKVAITANMFDALGRLIKAPVKQSSSEVDASMDDINILFEKHAIAREAMREEEEKKRFTKRTGRFGPDEIFHKAQFQQELSDTASGKTTLSGFNKRTVNAGFYLEREVIQPLKKRRTGQADLNAMNAGIDPDHNESHDPGGVNTSHPLSVMLLNQLAVSDPAFKANFYSPNKPTAHPAALKEQVEITSKKKGKKSKVATEMVSNIAEPISEAWGVIGPVKCLEFGSASMNGSGGSSVPVGGKPSSQHDLRYSSVATAPASALSDEDSLLAPLRFGRPATAFGLDRMIYAEGQGSKYKGFTHRPLATSLEKPIELGGMLNRLEGVPAAEMSVSEDGTEAEEASESSNIEEEMKKDEGIESWADEEPDYIQPERSGHVLDQVDSISLSSETVASDVKRYRKSLKGQIIDDEISLASRSIIDPTDNDGDISLDSELTDPNHRKFQGRSSALHKMPRADEDSTEDSVISLDSSSVIVSASYTNSKNSISISSVYAEPRDVDMKKALDNAADTKHTYQLRASKRKVEMEKSSVTSDDNSDNMMKMPILNEDDFENASDGSYETTSDDGDDGDISNESSVDDNEENESSSESSDASSDDSDDGDDSDIGDISLHSVDDLEKMRAAISNSVTSNNSSTTAEEIEVDTIARIRLMRLKMMELENNKLDRGRSSSLHQVEAPSVSLNSETTEMQSQGSVNIKSGNRIKSNTGPESLLPDSVSLHSQSVDQADGDVYNENRTLLIQPDSVSLVSQSIAETSEGQSQLDQQFDVLNNQSERNMLNRDSVSLASQSLMSDVESEEEYFDDDRDIHASYHEIHADSISLDSGSQVSGAGYMGERDDDGRYEYIPDLLHEDTISLDSASVVSGFGDKQAVKLAIVKQKSITENISLQSLSEELSSEQPGENVSLLANSAALSEAGDFDDSVSEMSDAGDSPEQSAARYAWAILIASTSRLFAKSVIEIGLKEHQLKDGIKGSARLEGCVVMDVSMGDFGVAYTADNSLLLKSEESFELVQSTNKAIAEEASSMPQLMDILSPTEVVSSFADAAVSIYLGEAIYKLGKLGYRNKNGLIVYKGINDQLTHEKLLEIIRREKREMRRNERANKRLKKTMERVRKHEEKLTKKKAKADKKRRRRRGKAHHITGRNDSVKRRTGILGHITNAHRPDRPESSTHSKTSKGSQSEIFARKEDIVPFKPIRATINFIGFKLDAPPSLLQTPVIRDSEVIGEPKLIYLSGWTPRGTWSARTVPKAMVKAEKIGFVPPGATKTFKKSGKDLNYSSIENLSSFLDQHDESLKHLQQQHSSIVAGTFALDGTAGLTQSVFQGLRIGELAFDSVMDMNTPGGRGAGSSVIILDTILEQNASSNKLRKELSGVDESYHELAQERATVESIPPIEAFAEDCGEKSRSQNYSADFELISQDGDSEDVEYLDLDDMSKELPIQTSRSKTNSLDGDDLSELSADNEGSETNYNRVAEKDNLSSPERDGATKSGKSACRLTVPAEDDKKLKKSTGNDDMQFSETKNNISMKVFDGRFPVACQPRGQRTTSDEDIDEGRMASRDEDQAIKDSVTLGSVASGNTGHVLANSLLNSTNHLAAANDYTSESLHADVFSLESDSIDASLLGSSIESSQHMISGRQSESSKGRNGFVSLSSGGNTGQQPTNDDSKSISLRNPLSLDSSTINSNSISGLHRSSIDNSMSSGFQRDGRNRVGSIGTEGSKSYVSVQSTSTDVLDEHSIVSLQSGTTDGIDRPTQHPDPIKNSNTSEDGIKSLESDDILPKIEIFVDGDDADSAKFNTAAIWWPELEAPKKASAVSFADHLDCGESQSPNNLFEGSVVLPQISSIFENDKKSITSLQRELVLHKPPEWSAAVVRIYQEIKFEIRDGVTTELLGEFAIPFSDFVSSLNADHKCRKKLKLNIRMKRKGHDDLILRGNLECEVDASDPVYKPPKFDNLEHFLNHRPQHWTVYPNCPINIGIVRQKYKDIARQYDRQRIVNPTMFGFRVRFYGDAKDESKFVHPMFTGYTFGRKPATKEQMEALHLQEVREMNPNPWRWQPGLEKLGLCPICTTGLKGCPRCFTMPVKDNGEAARPEDFQYDPEKDLAKRAAKEAKVTQKAAAIALKKRTRRFLIEAGVLSDHGSDEEQESDSSGHKSDNEEDEPLAKGELHLHTKLTTFEGLRLWRNIVQIRLTIWIKIMPGGEVRKYGVEADDPVWHLHNMFLSHSEYGNVKGGMLILPTYNGFFEIDNVIQLEDEHVTAKDTGRILLRKYGMRQRDNAIALLFFPQYKRKYIPSLFKGFYNQNVENLLTKDLSVYPELYYLPEDLSQDLVQNDLKLIFDRHYLEQQLHYKAKIRQREIDFAARLHQKGVEKRQKRLDAIREEQNRLKQEERRIESQLKGLEGEEREQKRKMLMERLLERNQQIISDIAGDEARRRLAKRQTRLEVLREKRMANMAAANALHPVIEGDDEDYDISSEDNDGMEKSIRSEVTQESVNTLNTKGVQELSASQISHVLASHLESTISQVGGILDDYTSDVSLSEASKSTRQHGEYPSVSIVIDPSKDHTARDMVSLTDTSMGSSQKHIMSLPREFANSLTESLKLMGSLDDVSLDESGAISLDTKQTGKSVRGYKISIDASSRASSLRNKFKRVTQDSDKLETESDVGSVVSDVSEVTDKKLKRDKTDSFMQDKTSRPNTSRGDDSNQAAAPSNLSGLDLSNAAQLPPSSELSDDDESVMSLTSVSSINSKKKKKALATPSQRSSAAEGSPEGKLSRANSSSSIISDDSSIGFHPSAGESAENQSVHTSKSGISRTMSKQESFVFKKFEITNIQEHNVKASLLGHARMTNIEGESIENSSIPNALKSSNVHQPGIQIKKKEFNRQDSYDRIAKDGNGELRREDDDQSINSIQSISSVDTGMPTRGLFEQPPDQSGHKDVSGSDVDISSSSDDSRDSRTGHNKKKKKKKHKTRQKSTPPSSDEDGKDVGRLNEAGGAKPYKKQKNKAKEDPINPPIPDLHEHTRGISVKKPYSTGYSNKLLKPLPKSDKRVIEAAEINEQFLRSSTPPASKKLDPVQDIAAKTYESTFLRFLNPAFRKSHKKT